MTKRYKFTAVAEVEANDEKEAWEMFSNNSFDFAAGAEVEEIKVILSECPNCETMQKPENIDYLGDGKYQCVGCKKIACSLCGNQENMPTCTSCLKSEVY